MAVPVTPDSRTRCCVCGVPRAAAAAVAVAAAAAALARRHQTNRYPVKSPASHQPPQPACAY